MEPGPQVNVLDLFRKPHKWSAEHLGGLHIEQHDHTHIAAIVGDTLLPKNGDSLFETVAEEFSQPTKEQIIKINLGRFENNRFRATFDDIWNALNAFECGRSVQPELDRLAGEFIRVSSHARYLDRGYSLRSIPFCLSSLHIRGKLTHVGTYFRPPDRSLPFTIFVSRTGSEILCSTEEIVPYLLFQAILKYERNPILNSHTTFVVGMKETTLQFNKAEISREYLKDLISHRVSNDSLILFRSDSYELLEQNDRRECVRGFLGLMENVRTQLDLYEIKES